MDVQDLVLACMLVGSVCFVLGVVVGERIEERKAMERVLLFDGTPVSKERQADWDAADKHGLHPSALRFIGDEPCAVYKDGSGIYGPCPPKEHWDKK